MLCVLSQTADDRVGVGLESMGVLSRPGGIAATSPQSRWFRQCCRRWRKTDGNHLVRIRSEYFSRKLHASGGKLDARHSGRQVQPALVTGCMTFTRVTLIDA